MKRYLLTEKIYKRTPRGHAEADILEVISMGYDTLDQISPMTDMEDEVALFHIRHLIQTGFLVEFDEEEALRG